MSAVREALTTVYTDVPTLEALHTAAQTIAETVLNTRYTILDIRDQSHKKTLEYVIGTLATESRDRAYQNNEGRPILFEPFHFTSQELVHLMKKESIDRFADVFLDRVLSVPEYRARTAEIYTRIPHRFPALPEDISPRETVREFLKSIFDDKYTNISMNLREVLKAFGNPPRYPQDDTSKWYEDPDPTYPMLIPIINVSPTTDLLQEDVLSVLDVFNQKYEKNEKELRSGIVRFDQIFTPTELTIAEESAAIVNLVSGAFYQSWQLPHTSMLIIAPCVPFDAIEKRYGNVYEGWLRHGPNDELSQEFRSAYIEQI